MLGTRKAVFRLSILPKPCGVCTRADIERWQNDCPASCELSANIIHHFLQHVPTRLMSVQATSNTASAGRAASSLTESRRVVLSGSILGDSQSFQARDSDMLPRARLL